MTDVRIGELQERVLQAQQAYHNGTPTISDEEYDALVDELADLDAVNQLVKNVGAPAVSEWKKAKHENPMGSLDKVNTSEELDAWWNSRGSGELLLITEKLDGISVQLKYVGGRLHQAVTRGDGKVGEDITTNVRRMQGIPSKLPAHVKAPLVVRGEIILTKSDHEAWFKSEYANTRNAASGIAKRLDGRGSDHLTVMVYQIVDGISSSTEKAQFDLLRDLGFSVPNYYTSDVSTPQVLWGRYEAEKRARLDYDIDGLVVRINDLAKQVALGDKDFRPLGAVAYKFAAVSRETIIRQVLHQTGGTGRITPVAVFDPVNLLGATVTNASVYNWKYIRDLGIDIGASVLVARANDVIPRVVRVTKPTGSTHSPPDACPSCKGPVKQDGEYLVCSSTFTCSAQVTGRVAAWIASLNILEWGDTVLERLVASGLVQNVPDLYRLTKDQLAGLERMGPKSAEKLLGTLHAEKELPLEVLLGALSIPGIGSSTIKLAMDAGYDSWETLSAVTQPQLGAIPGFGPVRAETLFSWMRDQGAVVKELESVGVRVKAKIQGKLTGKSFCFTGTMVRKRPDLEAMVVDNGGEVKGSVSKKLTYLVLADHSTTKAAAAKKFGTQLLTEDEFLQLVEG